MSLSSSHVCDQYRRQVRDFAQNKLGRYVTEQISSLSEQTMAEMAKLGLFGCEVPSEYGGFAHDVHDYLAAVEELACVDGSTAAIVASHNSLGIGSILRFGTESQKSQWLPLLCTGQKLWGFALTERHSGSDVKRSQCRADYEHNKWRITGHKHWITNTATKRCAGVTLMARCSSKPSFSCFLIPSQSQRFEQKPLTGKLMWQLTSTGHLIFDGVEASHDQLLGQQGRGLPQMLEILDTGRLSIAAMAVGLSRGAYGLARQHALVKNTFGHPLIDHQAVGFMLAEMKTKITAASALLREAVDRKASGQPYRIHASMTKLFSSEVAEFCARQGLQITGGEGLFSPHPMERFYRDATILKIGEGTSEIQKLIISRHLKDHE